MERTSGHVPAHGVPDRAEQRLGDAVRAAAQRVRRGRVRDDRRAVLVGSRDGGWRRRGAFYTLVPIRPRRRCERRSLRTFPGASLRPGSLAFNPRPRRLSTPSTDAFGLHPDIIARMERPSQMKDSYQKARVLAFFAGTGLAGVSSYLLYVLAVPLGGAECVYCLTSAAISFTVFSIALGGLSSKARSHYIITLVPIRTRPRGERRSLRTFPPPVVSGSAHASFAFNPDTPRRLSTPPLTPLNSTGRISRGRRRRGWRSTPSPCSRCRWVRRSPRGATRHLATPNQIPPRVVSYRISRERPYRIRTRVPRHRRIESSSPLSSIDL